MTVIFDGKDYARKRQVLLGIKIFSLGHAPKLATILVGEDPASVLYVNLKRKKAQEIGAKVEVYKVHDRKGADHIIRLIRHLNTDPETDGIMVQLPLPARIKREDENKVIAAIAPEKDVDGLLPDSPFVHPTAMAVEKVIAQARKQKCVRHDSKVLVIGSMGRVGSAIFKHLTNLGFDVRGVDRRTRSKYHFSKLLASKKRKYSVKIIIGATGDPGFIKAQHVIENFVGIDIGAPKGDFDFEDVVKKAVFMTPVPGGVGPVTIYCLLENLVKAGYNRADAHLPGAP